MGDAVSQTVARPPTTSSLQKSRTHINSMRANLADALGLDESAVSVKARSNDGLGPEGEGTACSAWVNVLVYPSGAA